jgi:hypothetical protein
MDTLMVFSILHPLTLLGLVFSNVELGPPLAHADLFLQPVLLLHVSMEHMHWD